jgi:magnesium chelatase family protein
MCSPIVVGSQSPALGVKQLRIIRTNGKKATQLCQCGYYGDSSGQCRCTPEKIQRYLEKVSGPLLDRIDLSIAMPRPVWDELNGRTPAPALDSGTLAAQVAECRQRQKQRAGKFNSDLNNREVERYCALASADEKLLENAMEKLKLSARAYHRILKMARTIADFEEKKDINQDHLIEAIAYRSLDRYFSFSNY